jgi:hypothetical protein
MAEAAGLCVFFGVKRFDQVFDHEAGAAHQPDQFLPAM